MPDVKTWELFTPAERRLAVLLFALAVLGEMAHFGGHASPEVARWLEGDPSGELESTASNPPVLVSLPMTADTVTRAVVPAKQSAATDPVNPNTADLAALMRLPGVGPVLARRIIDDRNGGGPYGRPEDLLRVPGIGPAKLAKLRDHLVF